jgi:hypothetical protein
LVAEVCFLDFDSVAYNCKMILTWFFFLIYDQSGKIFRYTSPSHFILFYSWELVGITLICQWNLDMAFLHMPLLIHVTLFSFECNQSGRVNLFVVIFSHQPI